MGIEERIKELTSLESGWDGYKAGPVSHKAANKARSIIDAIQSADPQLTPGVSGNVAIEWLTKDWSLMLEIDGSGKAFNFDMAEE